jgi:peroxiredoxin
VDVGEALFRRLDAFMDGFMERVDPAMARTIAEAAERLRASGVLDAVPKAGDIAPDFELPDQNGRPVSLRRRLQSGPVVLTFFRGGWCPFCSLALRALDEVSRELRRSGADIMAISPETAAHAMETAERNSLSFPVLTDPGNRVARQYGLVWELGPELREVYERLGHVLPRINGTSEWTLPIPAGFVIASNGRIKYAHANTDLTRRLEPRAAVDAVRGARETEGAEPRAAQ